MSNIGSYSLQLISKSQSDVTDFAIAVQKLVKETDKRPIKEEIKNMKSRYHVDNYFIGHKDERVGVVKIFQATFFSLGLESHVPKSDYSIIIKLIENNLGAWRMSYIEATLNEDYVQAALLLGFATDFSRVKMELDLICSKNIISYDDVISRTYKRGDLTHLTETFIDAYRDTIDERIGFISPNTASSALSSILRGYYGDFQPNLSPIIVAEGSTYIEGASLTTISEENPFVVLIGVRRAEQSKRYGRKLLSYVIHESKENNYDKLRLWVTSENMNAMNLYRSVGFRNKTRIYSLTKNI